jgi:CrcB protein
MKNALLVGLGAMLGAMARYGLLVAFPLKGFPWAIALINVSGSFLLGLVAAFMARDDPKRLFLGTGILGGYTTYSTFSLDVVEQFQRREYLAAVGNVSLQTVGSIALCAVGFALGSKLSS